MYTGARIGEVPHPEWDDFNLDTGYWHLRKKPDCPGIEGLGWSPKWGKARFVKRFSEALGILNNIPGRETVGYIKGDDGTKIAIPAGFVFPKKLLTISDNCRVKS